VHGPHGLHFTEVHTGQGLEGRRNGYQEDSPVILGGSNECRDQCIREKMGLKISDDFPLMANEMN